MFSPALLALWRGLKHGKAYFKKTLCESVISQTTQSNLLF